MSTFPTEYRQSANKTSPTDFVRTEAGLTGKAITINSLTCKINAVLGNINVRLFGQAAINEAKGKEKDATCILENLNLSENDLRIALELAEEILSRLE